jgi:hypothetical protein
MKQIATFCPHTTEDEKQNHYKVYGNRGKTMCIECACDYLGIDRNKISSNIKRVAHK